MLSVSCFDRCCGNARFKAGVTGSFNFTKAAEEANAENLLNLRDSALSTKYAENWKLHAGHSEGYAGK
jgi:phosphatidylserine/phosphatidylglycerophosphate/cardiolipin synthase-like enzyme